MRGRSSKQETKGMKIDKLIELKEEPNLSGAYIRSLLKQTTSSRTKDPVKLKDPGFVDGRDGIPVPNLTKFGEGFSETRQTQLRQPQQQHKKQVRRRLHTSRPYQERLLNMAEARREIVTALKFHRAAMKQAHEQQQPLQPLSPQPSFEQEAKIKFRTNSGICPSSTPNFSNYVDHLSYSSFSHFTLTPNPFSFASSPIAAPPLAENLNLRLPNQTLGLNLNFHDFNNLQTTLYQNGNNPSMYSFSSRSSSSSPTLFSATEEIPSVTTSQEGLPPALADVTDPSVSTGGGGLHPAMDDEEMAEIRSIGEQHQMEWNDTMNLVMSAWWLKILKTMELGPEVKAEDDVFHLFDEVMEFPVWLNANETCLQKHLDDYYL